MHNGCLAAKCATVFTSSLLVSWELLLTEDSHMLQLKAGWSGRQNESNQAMELKRGAKRCQNHSVAVRGSAELSDKLLCIHHYKQTLLLCFEPVAHRCLCLFVVVFLRLRRWLVWEQLCGRNQTYSKEQLEHAWYLNAARRWCLRFLKVYRPYGWSQVKCNELKVEAINLHAKCSSSMPLKCTIHSLRKYAYTHVLMSWNIRLTLYSLSNPKFLFPL